MSLQNSKKLDTKVDGDMSFNFFLSLSDKYKMHSTCYLHVLCVCDLSHPLFTRFITANILMSRELS